MLCLLVRACKIRVYFEPLLKKREGKKKKKERRGEKEAKQRAQVSPAGIPMHGLFLERALLIHGSQAGVIRVPPTAPPPDGGYRGGVGKRPCELPAVT